MIQLCSEVKFNYTVIINTGLEKLAIHELSCEVEL